MTLVVETEKETDGRWIAEIQGLPAIVLVYGSTRKDASDKAKALALQVIAEHIGGAVKSVREIKFQTAA